MGWQHLQREVPAPAADRQTAKHVLNLRGPGRDIIVISLSHGSHEPLLELVLVGFHHVFP